MGAQSEPDLAAGRRPGSLFVVGAGIRPGLHLTQEAKARIERADEVLYMLAEVGPTAWIHELNPSARSLSDLYRLNTEWSEIYEKIVEAALTPLRQGRRVCMISYGHPAVFDESSHEAVRRARAEGFHARMLPAVSSLDCLFVDLSFDPGAEGLQLFDATDWLVFRRRPEVTVPLVLWQISVIGATRTTGTVNRRGLELLSERLAEFYGAIHKAVVYEAQPFPTGRPLVEVCSVQDLPQSGVTGLSSLFVPAKDRAVPDPAILDRLGGA